MILLPAWSLLLTTVLLSLVSAAINDSCLALGEHGICIKDVNCQSGGGKTYFGFCPNDASDVLCCTKRSCGGGGECRMANDCPSGNSVKGLCPGPDIFQCCSPGNNPQNFTLVTDIKTSTSTDRRDSQTPTPTFAEPVDAPRPPPASDTPLLPVSTAPFTSHGPTSQFTSTSTSTTTTASDAPNSVATVISLTTSSSSTTLSSTPISPSLSISFLCDPNRLPNWLRPPVQRTRICLQVNG